MNENKQPSVRYFHDTSDIKKEDDMMSERRKKLLAEIEAGEDNERLTWEEFYQKLNSQKMARIKQTKRRSCDSCGKSLACRSALCRHKKTCKKVGSKAVQSSLAKVVKDAELPVRSLTRDKGINLCLKWNGKFWETRAKNMHCQISIGRDLSNLLDKRAIKEDALNCTQKEYIQMYKSLFLDL